MRHAYLIMAHYQPELLGILLSCLDCYDNDIVVHIDCKSKMESRDFENATKKCNLYFMERSNVTWGGYSQIDIELKLLEFALKLGKHDFYHLLTGSDLPLKPISKINAFFEENYGVNFINFSSDEYAKSNYDKRLRYKHYFREKCVRGRKDFYAVLNRIGIIIQKFMKKQIDKEEKEKFFLGSAYFDISEELAIYIIDRKVQIEKRYKKSSCCDEVFLQSIVWNSIFRNTLYRPYLANGMQSNMRYIDFENGAPRIIEEVDVDSAFASGMLFARKFDYEKNPGAIYKVLETVLIV